MSRFAKRCYRLRVQLELDSSSSVLGLEKAYSTKPCLLSLIQSFRRECASSHITLRVLHIIAHYNACADLLSHNLVTDARCLAMREFGLELVMVP